MASSEGFLTEDQREMQKIAAQNAEVMSSLSLSTSPKSPTQTSFLLSEHHHVKAPRGGKSATAGGLAVRHVRRTHSGKLIRVKKGKVF
ncbi:programmed cell death 4-like [Olea europaea subsp. europaea]|uniref:Programmed cell death 4-like n=1 Tax=Olea europaea subsp. europaea TaxID=158383 RepID=A0A8S0QHM9_OLEEU|nr:programmed cell death 4-like [Olea europaea subsp. europaea]